MATKGAKGAEVTRDTKGIEQMMGSAPVMRWLEQLGQRIVAHAISHTGVDTGALVGSMDHLVVQQGRTGGGQYKTPELIMGSNLDGRAAKNPKTGQDPDEYAEEHWDLTRPWVKAFDELGIEGDPL